MTALEGTFKTPVGEVPKKAAVLVGGGLLLVVAVMYVRGRNTSGGSAQAATGEIDPATGFVYGSPEDVAALAAQGGTIGAVGGSGGSGGSGGGGGNPVGPGGFTNNAEWVQYVVAGLTNASIVEDASALSVALGKYIAGQPVGDNTTMRSLIEQAIAFAGQPPVAGPNGYPPSINTQNPTPETSPAPTALPTTATAPAGKNLYDWCNEQGVSFVAVFGDEHGTGALNPGARKLMHWAGPEGSTKIPTFSSPQLLRIR